MAPYLLAKATEAANFFCSPREGLYLMVV